MAEEERVDRETTDADFISFSRVKRQHFLNNQAAFTAFDADFNPPFGSDWLAAIEDFENIPPDSVVNKDVEQATLDLAAQLRLTMQAMEDLEYFVKRAFPNDARIMREFGFNLARKQQHKGIARLAISLLVTVGVSQAYDTELTAAGMTPAVRDNLKDQLVELLVREAAQEFGKRFRIRITGMRIKQFNYLHGFFESARAASRVVFRNDAERQQLFEK